MAGSSFAIVLKEIHPAKLNVRGMKTAMRAIAEQVSRDMLLDYVYTVATWKHSPKFKRIIQIGPDTIEILVGTDDKIYGYVDLGTKKNYPIPKPGNKKAKVLRFQGVYTAKTVPGLISSKSGGPSGPIVYRKSVIHPGIKARRFSKEIAKKWDKKLKREVEKGMSKIAKASGHSMK